MGYFKKFLKLPHFQTKKEFLILPTWKARRKKEVLCMENFLVQNWIKIYSFGLELLTKISHASHTTFDAWNTASITVYFSVCIHVAVAKSQHLIWLCWFEALNFQWVVSCMHNIRWCCFECTWIAYIKNVWKHEVPGWYICIQIYTSKCIYFFWYCCTRSG